MIEFKNDRCKIKIGQIDYKEYEPSQFIKNKDENNLDKLKEFMLVEQL